ncbi:TetR/AcrR family transcriptional regulator [Phormidesmis priestleyi]
MTPDSPLPMTELKVLSAVASPKQEQILRGAMRVFLRSGYAGTSMDRVATEAGVSKQTIYSHFRDKERLFIALIERATIRHFQETFCSESLRGDPALMLRQIAETYFLKVVNQEYLSLFRLIIAESARFPELAKLYTRAVVVQGRQLLRSYFDLHPEMGIDDPDAIAQIFFGSLVSFVVLQEVLYGKDIIPMDRDRLINNLINLVLAQGKKEKRDKG